MSIPFSCKALLVLGLVTSASVESVTVFTLRPSNPQGKLSKKGSTSVNSSNSLLIILLIVTSC